MKIFLDTSVMVAAHWDGHPGHEASLEIFEHATKQTVSCGLHSLAEVYATMTALPVKNRILADQATLIIEDIRSRCAIFSLTEEEYAMAIDQAASRGLTSGKVYDALLLRCAEKANVDAIYTWNLKHFRAINPALADKIRTP